MTEHHGIDILCDAADSDLLLNSLFSHVGSGASGAAVVQSQQRLLDQSRHTEQQQQLQHQQRHHDKREQEQEDEEEEKLVDDQTPDPQNPVPKRVKLSVDTPTGSSAAGNAGHVCNICKRVYERADHLTRHMRSHENARQYKCLRCPKRFNRADLLTRHEATHDREGEAGRPLIRRSDRAAEACLNCAASKAKCDDQKPCGRCRSKSLVCQTPSRRMSTYKAASDGLSESAASPSETSTMGGQGQYGAGYGVMGPKTGDMNMIHATGPNEAMPAPGLPPELMRSEPILDGIPDDMIYFDPVHNFFQDMDFTSWDLNFDAFSVPQLETIGPSPQSTATTSTSKLSRTVRDPSKGHSAFKQSPWLWDPDTRDFGGRDADQLNVDENTIHSPAFDRLLHKPVRRLKMSHKTRDRLFAIVLAETKDPMRVPSFPSLELLNFLLQAHFVQDEYNRDSFIHAASFEPDEALSELLAAIIASGSMFVAVSSIWQFGFALQEVVRQRMETIFESSNTNVRNLKCWQANMTQLDINLFSGFKRQTELAESFLQPLTTMIRRSGVMSAPTDSAALVPLATDSPEVLEVKWQKFIMRESCKRVVIHLLFHDVHAAVMLQKKPLLSVMELLFSLPASRDLWKAPTAEAWRSTYLSKRPLPTGTTVPRISELMHSFTILDMFSEYIDVDLCYSVVLYGFWSQIDSYRGSLRFYSDCGLGGKRNSTHRLWLKSQHQELYRDLLEFSTVIYSSRNKAANASLAVTAELFQMTLHVSIDDLQQFAGKSGEDESRRMAAALEDGWARTPEARYAVWHAGQVLQNARRMPPTTLRGFSAMAAYFASLTLWVYGLLACSHSNQGVDGEGSGGHAAHLQAPRLNPSSEFSTLNQHHHQLGTNNMHANATRSNGAGPSTHPFPDHVMQPPPHQPHRHHQHPNQHHSTNTTTPPSHFVLLDGDETRETRAFLQLDRGIPALTLTGDPAAGVESLSNPGMVLTVARNLFRDNFPVRSEPLPPLVESLVNLLRDLGSGVAGRPSRAASEVGR